MAKKKRNGNARQSCARSSVRQDILTAAVDVLCKPLAVPGRMSRPETIKNSERSTLERIFEAKKEEREREREREREPGEREKKTEGKHKKELRRAFSCFSWKTVLNWCSRAQVVAGQYEARFEEKHCSFTLTLSNSLHDNSCVSSLARSNIPRRRRACGHGGGEQWLAKLKSNKQRRAVCLHRYPCLQTRSSLQRTLDRSYKMHGGAKQAVAVHPDEVWQLLDSRMGRTCTCSARVRGKVSQFGQNARVCFSLNPASSLEVCCRWCDSGTWKPTPGKRQCKKRMLRAFRG